MRRGEGACRPWRSCGSKAVAAMAAERATAAERMAATGPVVMVGDVLRLGRVGGGSGWLLGLGGDAPAKGSRHGSLPAKPYKWPWPFCGTRGVPCDRVHTIGVGAPPERRLPLRTTYGSHGIPIIHTYAHGVNSSNTVYQNVWHLFGAGPSGRTWPCLALPCRMAARIPTQCAHAL